jgi:uncharacterized damage-inducible protein DinB
MDQRALLVKFWKAETETTRKVLSRIPENSDYRPDPKSRTAREIAWLIVTEHLALVDGLEKGTIAWEDRPPAATIKEMLDMFDGGTIAQRIEALGTAQWERKVPFTMQGQEVMNETGYEFGWGFLFDLVHHRGQVTSYLRAMGSTVPQIYGPSADEPM